VRPRFTRRGLRFIKRALAAHRRVTLTITVIERDPRGRVTKRTLRTRLHG
jgi:hypothetical protein